MADWFEHDVDLHDDPKVKALANRLREPLAEAYVTRVYGYCYKHVIDRFDAEIAREIIEDAARWRGRRGVLFDALFACGFLERDCQKIIVHGVGARLAPHIARQAASKERQRKHREKLAAAKAAQAGVTLSVTRDVTRDGRRDVTVPSRSPTADTNTDTNREAALLTIRPLSVHLQGNHPTLCEAIAAASRQGVGIEPGRLASAWGEAESLIGIAGMAPVVASWVESARKRDGDIGRVPLAYVLPATRDLVKRGASPKAANGRPDTAAMDYSKPPEF